MTQFEDFWETQNDEIYQAAFELIKAMTRNPDMEWDVHYIGELVDAAADLLAEAGLEVCYPFYSEPVAKDNENGESGEEEGDGRTPCYPTDECKTADCPMRQREVCEEEMK